MHVPTLRAMRVAFAAGLLLPTLAHAGNLIVVDASGGGDFTSIEAALQAASNGDLLLVKTGNYQAFLVNGKTVDIVADAGAVVTISGGPRVAWLPAGGRVRVVGLTVHGIASATLFGGHGINVVECLGAVRIEHCELNGADNTQLDPACFGWGDASGWEGASVVSSNDVVFSHCTLRGGAGMHLVDAPGCAQLTPGGGGGHGIRATGSTVAIYESVLTGGDGGLGGSGGTGGAGVHGASSTVFLSGGLAQGGNGGAGIQPSNGHGGDGGDGVDMTSGAAQLAVLDASLNGGALGPGATSPGLNGEPVAGGTTTAYAGHSRSLSVPFPVREGGTLPLSFNGQPGDLAFAVLGPTALWVPLPQYFGVLHVDTASVFAFGSLGASGAKTIGVPIGALGASDEFVVLPFQAVCLSTALDIVLGSTAHAFLLDASF